MHFSKLIAAGLTLAMLAGPAFASVDPVENLSAITLAAPDMVHDTGGQMALAEVGRALLDGTVHDIDALALIDGDLVDGSARALQLRPSFPLVDHPLGFLTPACASCDAVPPDI